MWLLNKIIDGLSTLAGLVVSFFATVLDLVIGIGALPILGPLNIFLNIILSIICGVADVLCNGVMGIITYDQFGHQTLFDVAFSTEKFYLMLRAFAVSMLVLIYIFQLTKTMVTPPSENADDPLGLTARTFVSGILIFAAQYVIRIAFQCFGTIYTAIGNGANFHISFGTFSSLAQELITEDLPALGIRAQLLTLLALLFLIVMCFAIAKKVVTYMVELCLRFTIVGVLLVTAPLGATLYASKSTRNSFSAWVRMIASQFVLLIFGVFFMRLFCTAFNAFGDTFHELHDEFDTGHLMTLVLWTCMVYAILSVGAKVDSLLKTLGLSVAECGEAAATAMVGDMQQLGTGVSSAFMYGAMVLSGAIEPGDFVFGTSRAVSNLARVGANVVRKHQVRKKGEDTLNNIGMSAPSTVSEINRAVPYVSTTPVRGAHDTRAQASNYSLDEHAARNLRDGLRGLSANLKSSLDMSSFKIGGGAITGKTLANNKGNRTSLIFIPIESERNRERYDIRTKPGEPGEAYLALATKEDLSQRYAGGREIMIGGQAYMMYALGDNARNFMVDSPRARKTFREMGEASEERITEVKDQRGLGTGIYQQLIYNSDGSLTKRFWAPLSRYEVDDALNATNVTIGDLTYARYDVDYGFSPMANNGTMAAPEQFCDWKESTKVQWFKKCFPLYQDAEVQSVTFEEGIYAATIDGQQTLTFSPLEYGVRTGAVPEKNVKHFVNASSSSMVTVTIPATEQTTTSQNSSPQVGPPVVTGGEVATNADMPVDTHWAPIGATLNEETIEPTHNENSMKSVATGAAQTDEEPTRPGPSESKSNGAVGLSAENQTGSSQQNVLFKREPKEILLSELKYDVVKQGMQEAENHEASAQQTSKEGVDEAKRSRQPTEDGRDVRAIESEERVKLSPILRDAINKRKRRKK